MLLLDAFGDAPGGGRRDVEPHRLCDYLFDLAKAFTDFYEACPVLAAATDAQRGNRLALCRLTAATLRQGLELLGIAAPDGCDGDGGRDGDGDDAVSEDVGLRSGVRARGRRAAGAPPAERDDRRRPARRGGAGAAASAGLAVQADAGPRAGRGTRTPYRIGSITKTFTAALSCCSPSAGCSTSTNRSGATCRTRATPWAAPGCGSCSRTPAAFRPKCRSRRRDGPEREALLAALPDAGRSTGPASRTTTRISATTCSGRSSRPSSAAAAKT